MIEVESVSKHFGQVRALENVSFRVERGEIVGLLGQNGAGKTTMMRILSCFTPPTSGTARVDGLDVTREPLAIRQRVGYFLERVSIYPEMRVESFLRFAARVKGVTRKSVKRAVGEVIEQCGLSQVTSRIIGNLSKGFRQRVGLAQCLLNKPSVLLLDEPTAGLDPAQVVGIRRLIQGLAGERTVILSSHILSEVSQICSKVIIIHDGCVGAVDKPQDLGARLQDGGALRIVIDQPSPTVIEPLKGLQHILSVTEESHPEDKYGTFLLRAAPEADLPTGLWKLACQHGWIIREMTPVSMSLEEVFLHVVRRNGSE